MFRHKIKKISSVPKRIEPTAAALNKLLDNTSRGWGVDSDTVIIERLPDGRLRAHLHPDIVKQFQ